MDDRNFYKYFFINLIFILLNLTIIHSKAFAKDLSYVAMDNNQNKSSNMEYSFGAEGIVRFVAQKGDWSNLFRDQYSGFNFFIGYNWENIMFELGYMTNIKKGKEFSLLSGDQMFNLTEAYPTVINSSVKLRQTHFDVNIFNKIATKVDIITSIGLSFTRPHIHINSNNPLSVIGSELVYVLPKTNTIIRVGAGVYYHYSDTLGFRFMCHFDQYSKINLRRAGSGIENRPFKDAYTVSSGILFKV